MRLGVLWAGLNKGPAARVVDSVGSGLWGTRLSTK